MLPNQDQHLGKGPWTEYACVGTIPEDLEIQGTVGAPAA